MVYGKDVATANPVIYDLAKDKTALDEDKMMFLALYFKDIASNQ